MNGREIQADKIIDKENVIAHIEHCLDPSCNGWLVDSFGGKYWIRCVDPRHNVNNKKQVENGGQSIVSTKRCTQPPGALP